MNKSNLEQVGFRPHQAQAINGRVVSGLTAAGTTQADAAILTGETNVFSTVAAGTGCILGAPAIGSSLSFANPGDEIIIVNYGANTLNVYPPVGGSIDNGAANAAITVAANASTRIKCLTRITFAQC